MDLRRICLGVSLLLLSACGTMPVPQWQYVLRDVPAQPVPLNTVTPTGDTAPLAAEVVVRPLPPMPTVAVLSDELHDAGLGLGNDEAAGVAPAVAAPGAGLTAAHDSFDRGDYATTVAVLREAGVHPGDTGEPGALLERANDALYRRYLQQRRFASALELAQQVLHDRPGSRDWQQRLTRVTTLQRAEGLYQDYLLLPAQTAAQQRYDALHEILALDASHPGATGALAAMEKDLVEVFYQSGLRHYRLQQLQPAIDDWQKVLELDTGHQQARMYRDRALELQRRLDSLR